MVYSKNALNCSKCPGKGGDGGCPLWWETIWESPKTGEVKTVIGCGFEQLPMYLVEVVKASNRPAAAMESLRNALLRVATMDRVVAKAKPLELEAPSDGPTPS